MKKCPPSEEADTCSFADICCLSLVRGGKMPPRSPHFPPRPLSADLGKSFHAASEETPRGPG